jgi:hypothetical protein
MFRPILIEQTCAMLIAMRCVLAFVLLGACVLRDVGDAPSDAAASTSESSTSTSGSGPTADSGVGTTSPVDPSSEGTTQAADSSETSTSRVETSDAESSTGAVHVCEFDEHFTCEVSWDCSAFEDRHGFNCGGPLSWFDEQGCLRKACDDNGLCAAGFACINPSQVCRVCSGPQPNCEDSESSQGLGCSCSQDGACGGSICVPAELLVGDPCRY